MEEGRRQAAAFIVAAAAGGGEVADRSWSCCCDLCGDVGFREALLPCGARGCSRFQHTYCGRYCPDVVEVVGRWRCEWCAREEEGSSTDRVGEEEYSSRKRSRRAPSSRSPEMKQASPESERSSSADRERRKASAGHEEERKESTVPGVRAHAPRTASPGDSTTTVSVETDSLVVHEDNKQNASTTRGGGGGSRALDRWKNLAKRTRLGGKKYKLLTDVLC